MFVLGPDGTRYFPRLQSYEVNSGIASILMLDALPNGKFELHISGAEGLTDWAGLPIQGNHASGDYVVRFTVAGPVRGSEAGPRIWLNATANDSAETAAPEVDSSEETSTEAGALPEGEVSTPDTTADPPQRRPISRIPVRRRPARTPAIQESNSTEQPPAAISAPIALASSLAHTLRDRARRESLAPL